MTDDTFCTQCGNKVSASAQFCEKCGAPVEGRSAFQAREQQVANLQQSLDDSKISWISFLLIIYAIPALLFGIYYVVDSSGIVNILMSEPSVVQWMQQYNISTADLTNYIRYIGYVVVISGACIMVSFICTVKRVYWKLALVTCLIGSFLCIFSLFGFLIGLMVCWMIYSAKSLYQSSQKPSN